MGSIPRPEAGAGLRESVAVPQVDPPPSGGGLHGLSQAGLSQLVESHRSYSHAIAAEILRKCPPSVEKAEIEAAAEFGLVQAASAFDPGRGVLFKTFAYYRVRGAIYDAMRKMAWFSKSYQQRLKFEVGANELAREFAEEPRLANSAADEFADLAAQTGAIASCFMMSLDAKEDFVADQRPSAEEELVGRETHRRLRDAVKRLPEKNRRVLEGYYYDDKSLEEIGASMGLSKSWVCRVHAKSLEMVRDYLAEADAFPRRGPGRQETFAPPDR
jgi:RNA polymerase sigma factor FliA